MPSAALNALGPFTGADFKTAPYFAAADKGVAIQNADPHTYTNQLAIPFGRTLLAQITTDTGAVPQALIEFTTFSGGGGSSPIRITPQNRLYFYSLVNPITFASYQGYLSQNFEGAWAVTPLSTLPPFTSGVQFQDGMWFNNGYQVKLRSWGTTAKVIPWQLNTGNPANNPNGEPFTVQLLTPVADADSNLGVGTYSYAFCYVQHATADTNYNPAISVPDPPESTAQITSPIFINPIFNYVVTAPGYATPIQGPSAFETIIGPDGFQYDMALFRASVLQPVYYFVGWVSQMPPGTDPPTGDFIVLDERSDADIANNSQLILHNDPPPFLNDQVTITNDEATFSVTVTPNFRSFSPGFVAAWKNRIFCFVLYPETFDAAPIAGSVTVSPQLWFSEAGVPWSFDLVDDVLQIGPEGTPSNWDFTVVNPGTLQQIFQYGVLEDTPMGMASTGSILALFKSKTAWVLYGDSPAEFIDRNIVLDMGCLASNSICAAEGGIFWLAAQGIYFFSGAAPTLLSEPIWNDLQTYGVAALQQAVGWYQNRTFFLSIPNGSGFVTYSYYIPTQQWSKVNFGLGAVSSSTYPGNAVYGLVGGEFVAWWTNTVNDMGAPITAEWTGPITDSQAPGIAKYFRYMELIAPVGPPGSTATVTFTVDGGSPNGPAAFTNVFDLTQGPTQVISLPPTLTGFTSQLSVQISGPPGTAIDRVVVVGTTDKRDELVGAGY